MSIRSFTHILCIFLALLLSRTAPAQSFICGPVPDKVRERMAGRSCPPDAKVNLNELRLLSVAYYGFDGEVHVGQIVSHWSVARDLLQIFRELFLARYQIESIRLVDDFDGSDDRSMAANNSSCFNYRVVPGTQKLSRHALGVAIDINPVQNPYVTSRSVSPEAGKSYVDRSLKLPHMIDHDDLCCRLFKAHGFSWGGDWKNSKDYQHFEKNQ